VTLELHPEEMLDAARRGTLGPQGFADLHAHLDRCAGCRLALALGDDLRAEAAVTSADNALLGQMVGGALAEPGTFVPSPLPARASDTGPFGRSAGRFARRAAIALALLFVGGSAGAAIWSAGGTHLLGKLWPEIVPLPRKQQSAPASDGPAASRARAATPLVPPLPPSAPAPAPAPEETSGPARPRVHAPTPVALETADDVFADANRARRAGDYDVALRRYAQLHRQFPGTRQEMTARVIVGDLSLTSGATRDALTSFDSYLAASPEGTLAEEARVGRALALQKLGRRGEERDAWKQLLRRHPDSVQVTRARDRLTELGE
jgi:TolA-binding protein